LGFEELLLSPSSPDRQPIVEPVARLDLTCFIGLGLSGDHRLAEAPPDEVSVSSTSRPTPPKRVS